MNKELRNLFVFAALLLGITILNLLFPAFVTGYFGLIPRTGTGLLGILTSPLIHGNFGHLFGNLISFSVLSFFVIQFGVKRFYRVLAISWVVTGIAVWLFARGDAHIGLSGVVYALWGYLLVYGVIRRSIKSLLIAIVVMFVYGSMAFGLLPIQGWGISFESHLFGAFVGGYFGYRYGRRDKFRDKYDLD